MKGDKMKENAYYLDKTVIELLQEPSAEIVDKEFKRLIGQDKTELERILLGIVADDVKKIPNPVARISFTRYAEAHMQDYVIILDRCIQWSNFNDGYCATSGMQAHEIVDLLLSGNDVFAEGTSKLQKLAKAELVEPTGDEVKVSITLKESRKDGSEGIGDPITAASYQVFRASKKGLDLLDKHKKVYEAREREFKDLDESDDFSSDPKRRL